MNTSKILIVSLLFTLPALADESTAPNLTLAAAETTRTFWINQPNKAQTAARTQRELDAKALELVEKINADLGKALEEKLNRELGL